MWPSNKKFGDPALNHKYKKYARKNNKTKRCSQSILDILCARN